MFYKKNAITSDIKKLEIIHNQQNFSSNLLSNPNGGFLTPEAQKNLNDDYLKKLKKKAKVFNKC